ncbi:MAG: phytase [Gammaproteobacteria bacterium]|nr:phytase [Gammaproteobacteria bacterium]MBU1832839.1 phytase [Gammaproteobacteria bacterium]
MNTFGRTLLASALLGISACSPLASVTNPSANALSFNKQHIFYTDASIYSSQNEIEAVTKSGEWLIWAEDPQRELWMASLSDNTLTPTKIATLDHGVDGLCAAPLSDTALDVFISDGDGGMHHYWLTPQGGQFHTVRNLAINPDVERCLLNESSLIYLDPYLGAMSVERNPETDTVIRPANVTANRHLIEQLSSAPESLILEHAHSAPQAPFPLISADLETDSVDRAGDAADDPAILVSDKGTLWIAGTDKQQGLRVYNAQGKQIHFLKRGRLNNVDSLALTNNRFLLSATNRTSHSIDLFIAEPDKNRIEFISAIPLAMDDPYGLCMAKDASGKIAVFAGDSEGLVQYWQLDNNYRSGNMLAEYHFDSQTEGCVYNTVDHQLYVGQEDKGIWKIAPMSGEKTLIETMAQGNLVADVEGLDIYYGDQQYLIASSQGDDSYVVYQIAPWKMLSKFRIAPNTHTGLDGASETDGLAVSAKPIKDYPQGIMVVQDGRNVSPAANQNFKIINWQKIEGLLKK